MIYEQAFQYLPEILSGQGYPSQEHEGGIVAAFTMAVLQELNARNVNNPLSLIQCEKLYRLKKASWPSLKKGGRPRYLRADLQVSIHDMRIGNSGLAAYGWRHANWLEAKYFRAFNLRTGLPKANSNQSLHTGELLADVYRILALCPRGVPKKLEDNPTKENRSNVGRYLLHVYSGTIEQHLSLKMKGRGERQWIKAITEAGAQSAAITLADEPSSVLQHVGSGLGALKLEFACTNFVIAPVESKPRSVTYTCILIRFDSFKLSLGGEFWGINEDRSIVSSGEEDAEIHQQISEFVGSRISLKGELETTKPSLSDLELEEDPDD